MRTLVAVLSIVLPGLGAACSRPVAAAPRVDELVLEVGGEHASLRQALVAAGAELPQPAAASAAAAPPPGTDAAGDPAGPEPVVAPAPAPDHLVVALGRGETLIHLAKRHLGDGNRFREILAANGWTERDARRLPEGQLVRIPMGPGPAPAPR